MPSYDRKLEDMLEELRAHAQELKDQEERLRAHESREEEHIVMTKQLSNDVMRIDARVLCLEDWRAVEDDTHRRITMRVKDIVGQQFKEHNAEEQAKYDSLLDSVGKAMAPVARGMAFIQVLLLMSMVATLIMVLTKH